MINYVLAKDNGFVYKGLINLDAWLLCDVSVVTVNRIFCQVLVPAICIWFH